MQNHGAKLKITATFLFFAVLFGLTGLHSSRAQETNESQISQEAVASLESDLSQARVELDVFANGRIGESARISAFTSNIDNNTAVFMWYIDDVLDDRSSGKAKTEFTFTTRKENHVVRLSVLEENELIAENAVLVSSYNISLTWHADTYTPPDYLGKAMPIRESEVTVTALPNIKGYDAEDLLYTWYVDAESRVRKVVGEQEFSFKIMKNSSSISVLVEVSNPSGSIKVSQAVLIPIVRPSVLVYSKALNEPENFIRNSLNVAAGNTADLIAKPFNFQAKNLLDFNYIWKFLGKTAQSDQNEPNSFSLKISDTSLGGISNLDLLVENSKFSRERAGTSIDVNIFRK